MNIIIALVILILIWYVSQSMIVPALVRAFPKQAEAIGLVFLILFFVLAVLVVLAALGYGPGVAFV
jgi:hypothetical protein